MAIQLPGTIYLKKIYFSPGLKMPPLQWTQFILAHGSLLYVFLPNSVFCDIAEVSCDRL